MVRRTRWVVAAIASGCVGAGAGAIGAAGQWLPDDGTYTSNEAIRYATSSPSDSVAQFQRRLDAGVARLSFDSTTGYLRSVLQALRVPVESQLLVFSRTSLQRDLISPERPRALYFGSSVYVGWIPGAPQLEIAAADSRLGAVFYTLRQEKTARPTFQRETVRCLLCHESARQTAGVPGFLMKSVLPDAIGEPVLSAGTHVTTDQSPFEQRWGGWYVTGSSGSQSHMGRRVAVGRAVTADVYLTSHSDIVALMVLAHQKHVQNLITRLNYRTRMAIGFDRLRNVELGYEAGFVPPETRNLIAREVEPLVQAMFFVDEAPLTEAIEGTSGFAETFANEGPRDGAGRSLRDMDLKHRLFRYPCSYLIYSESFDALPGPARDRVYERLWAVLSGEDRGEPFARLTADDRSAVVSILLDTKPDFAAWRAGPF